MFCSYICCCSAGVSGSCYRRICTDIADSAVRVCRCHCATSADASVDRLSCICWPNTDLSVDQMQIHLRPLIKCMHCAHLACNADASEPALISKCWSSWLQIHLGPNMEKAIPLDRTTCCNYNLFLSWRLTDDATAVLSTCRKDGWEVQRYQPVKTCCLDKIILLGLSCYIRSAALAWTP